MKKITILLIALSFSPMLNAQQGKRMALVIGNEKYLYGNSLKNPVNDAELMARTLSELGFKVTKILNATRKEMTDAITDFTEKSKECEAALFYYAGHGVQVEGINYIIPVDSKISKPIAVQFEALKVDNIVSQFEYYSGKTTLVILDACRENPFLSWVRGSMNTFVPANPPRGTLVAYATASGSFAYDNINSSNGLYTGVLVRQMLKAQRVEDVFINTRNEVYKASDGKQQSQEWSQLSGTFYFTDKEIEEISDKSLETEKINKQTDLTKAEFTGSAGEFIDIQDGNKYRWVRIGEQIWMAENSRKLVDEDNSFCYDFDKRCLKTHGMLYTWKGAQNACPAGWHLPSREEYEEMLEYIGGPPSEVAGKLKSSVSRDTSVLFWSKSVVKEITNSSGFSAFPVGWYKYPVMFTMNNRDAHFWTSSSYGKIEAVCIYIYCDYNRVYSDPKPKKDGMSVRCIKDR